MLGKILITMTENILNRMTASVIENDILTRYGGGLNLIHIHSYLESMIKIQLEHSQSLIKNASKYLDPLTAAYDAKNSETSDFIKSLKELDVSHATNLSETSKQIRDLIKSNISKNSELVKKTAEKLLIPFQKQSKLYIELIKKTDKAYGKFVQKFSQNEESFRSGDQLDLEQDLWFVQYQFLKKARESVDCITALKETLFLTWDHGKDKEATRLKAIKELYDGITTNSNAIFGANKTQEEIIAKLNTVDQSNLADQQFRYNKLVSEVELRFLYQLNGLIDGGVDWNNASDADIKNLIKKVDFDPAPESNLVLKTSIIKRESGVFSQFKEATAVLTRDK